MTIKATDTRIQLTIDKTKRKIIENVAKADGRSVNNWINQAISEKLERDDVKMLNELKKEYLNKEIKLVDLDNAMQGAFPIVTSIFEYDVKDMLENGYCYQTDNSPAGYNFEFEITKDNEDVTEIVVKITSIDEI